MIAGAAQTLLGRVVLFTIPFLAGGLAYAITLAVGLPPDRCLFWAIVVFVVALVVVLAVLLVSWMLKRLRAGKLEDGLAAGVGSYDQKGEIEALRKSWKESVAKLRGTAVGGGGRRALALLPWYVIIGAPASGKSTLLRQSGIDFPVGDAAIRGLQGTRNCDWWFSNVGVFLDTAGRYISDDHADEWTQFLDLVRRHRSAAPINGVIVAIPAQDLIERTEAEQELEARRIRARLDELIDHLGVNFPVWIVVTKVDLVGGFVEFFGNADATTRQQMMGWTVDQDEGARFDPGVFERRWATMVHRLREIRPVMIATAKLRDRPAAYGFPDEMGALAEPLTRTMQKIFEPNVYQETPLYRGLYITSATQQGTPLTRAAARVRQLLGAPSVDADAQGVLIKNAYFVTDLMQQRIVPDHGMTWTTRTEIDRGRMKRVGIGLTGSSVGVFGFLAVLAAGTCARHDLEGIEASLKKSRQADTSVVARCDDLHGEQEKATFGVAKNLGLSLPLPLQKALADREREIWRTEVAGSLLAGHVAAIEAAKATGSGGLEPLVTAYRDYQATASSLRAIAERRAKPASDAPPPPPPDKPADGAAPPVAPGQLPPDVLTEAQLKALRGRYDSLVKDGILQGGTGETPVKQVDRLLAVAWRNAGPDDTADAVMQKAEAALDRGLEAWFQRVKSALASRTAQAERQQQSIASRRSAFLEECDRAERLLQGENLAQGTLRKEAELLRDAVRTKAGDDASPGGGAAPAAGPDLSVLGSVVPSLALLAESKVRTEEQIARLAGWAEAKAYAEAEAALGTRPAATGPTAPAAGADAERALTSLDSIAHALDELLLEGPTPAADRRAWQASPTMSDAVTALTATFQARQDPWAASVVGQLRPFVQGAAADEAALRRHPVVRLAEALRLDRMLAEFAEDPDGFDSFAKRIETRRRPRPGVTELDGDLAQLAAPLTLAAKYPLVSADTVTALEVRVRESFGKVAAAANAQWKERIRAETSDPGDWSSCLDAWAEPDSRIGKLATEVDAAWGDARDSRFDDASRSDPLAAAIWREALDAFRPNLRQFKARVENARRGADALRKCLNRDLTDQSLQDMAGRMGRTGTDPVWRQGGVQNAIPSVAPFTEAAAALKSSLAAAEEALVERIANWFNNRWSVERVRIEAALKGGTPEGQRLAGERLDSVRAPLAAFFGSSLSDVPGGRLYVAEGWVTATTQILTRLGAPVSSDVTVTVECVVVPSSQAERGFPQIEVEYKEVGKPPTSERWLPGEPKRFEIAFTPGKGEYLTLRMRNDKTSAVKTFAQWNGGDCAVAALASGLGSTSDTLDWEGTGEFRGDHARFRLLSANAERIRLLARGGEAASAERLPEKCVEIRKR